MYVLNLLNVLIDGMCQEILNLKEYEHRYPAVNRKIQDNIHEFVTKGFKNNSSSMFLSFSPSSGQNPRYYIRRESLNSMDNELVVVSKNKKKTGRFSK